MNTSPQRRRPVRARLLAASAGAAMILGVAACGGGAERGDDVTLRVMWWGNPPRHQATNEAIKLYEKKHPNVSIEPIYTGWDGYWDKLATQMAGGNAPDVMQMDYAYLNDYAARGTLLDLKDYTGTALDVSGIKDKILQSGELRGGLYAIPWTTNTHALVVDTTDIKQAGLTLPEFGYTWEDLRKFGKNLAASDDVKYAIADMSVFWDVFEVWLRNHGQSPYTEKGKLAVSKQALRDYWTYWQELSKAEIATPPQLTTPADADFDQLSVVRGAAEMDSLWDNQFSGVAEYMKHDLALVPLPEGQQVGQYLKPSMFLSASARTEYPKEAADFIDFMVTNPQAGQILGTNRGIPADESIREKLATQATGMDKKVFAYEEQVADRLGPTPPAPPEGTGEIEILFSRMGENVAFGRMSVDKAASTFISRAQQILAD